MFKKYINVCFRLGHGDIIEEEGKSVPFRVEILHMHRLALKDCCHQNFVDFVNNLIFPKSAHS